MNSIVNRGAAASAVASLSSLRTGLANVASTIVTPGGMPILRLLKDGSWVYGAENVEVEEGSLWAANPFSLQHGWVSWTDKPGSLPNEIVGEVMVPATSPLPVQAELNDTGWPWSQQLSVELMCMNGADKGETVIYKTTSVGGLNAIKTLINEISAQLDRDGDNPVALVSMEFDTYMHKRHGKVYVPMLVVRDWLPLTEETPDVGEPEPEPEPEAKPARSRSMKRPAAQPKEDPAPEPDAPQVQVTAADRKAALLAEIAALEKETAEPETEVAAADAPRRRRRA